MKIHQAILKKLLFLLCCTFFLLQPYHVLAAVEIKGISSGDETTCVILSPSGFIQCLGKNQPPQEYKETRVSSIDQAMCATTEDGVPFCWGGNALKLPDNRASQLVTSYHHTCLIETTDGTIKCFNNTTSASVLPLPEKWKGLQFIKVAVGESFACGISKLIEGENTLACWGNILLQTSYKGLGKAVIPEAKLAGLSLRDVIVYGGVTCVITDKNQLLCWGNHRDEQLPFKQEVGYEKDNVSIADGIKMVSIGDQMMCAILVNGNTLHCWGLATTHSPLLMQDVSNFLNKEGVFQVSIGTKGNLCLVTENGRVGCFGPKGPYYHEDRFQYNLPTEQNRIQVQEQEVFQQEIEQNKVRSITVEVDKGPIQVDRKLSQQPQQIEIQEGGKKKKKKEYGCSGPCTIF